MQLTTTFKPFTYDDIVRNYETHRARIAKIENPRHRKMARNYLVHSILEAAGYGERIFAPHMTVEDPLYEFFHNGVRYEGLAQCAGFYQNLLETETIVIATEQRIAVADWGFCAEHVNNFYMTAATAAKVLGVTPASDDEVFVEHRQTIRLWPYTPDGRLKGETLYYAVGATYSRHPPAHAIKLSVLREVVAPLIELTMQEFIDNPVN